LVVGPPKSPASVRTVTVPDVLVEELRNHLANYVGSADDALLFTGPKGAVPTRGNWQVSVRWAERVKRPDCRPASTSTIFAIRAMIWRPEAERLLMS
jgi:hypothetical protein